MRLDSMALKREVTSEGMAIWVSRFFIITGENSNFQIVICGAKSNASVWRLWRIVVYITATDLRVE